MSRQSSIDPDHGEDDFPTAMRSRLFLSIFVAALCLHEASRAHAQVVTFQFSGHLSSVSPDLQPVLQNGMNFVLTYSFNSLVTDEEPLADVGRYRDAISQLTVSIPQANGGAGYLATESVASIVVENQSTAFSPTVDRYRIPIFQTISGADINGWPLALVAFDLIDTDATVFTNTDLPLTLDLSAFEQGASDLHLIFAKPDIAFRPATLVLDEFTVIPEPTTMAALLGITAVGFAGLRRWTLRRNCGAA